MSYRGRITLCCAVVALNAHVMIAEYFTGDYIWVVISGVAVAVGWKLIWMEYDQAPKKKKKHLR